MRNTKQQGNEVKPTQRDLHVNDLYIPGVGCCTKQSDLGPVSIIDALLHRLL